MARPPERKRSVYFLGAGFSSIAHLPNTAALLAEVHGLAETNVAWGISKDLANRLTDAYRFFYPDHREGFRPEVVDFFSVLSTYHQIDSGNLPEGFPDRALIVDLRFAIAHVICEKLRALTDGQLRSPHALVDNMIAPGNVVIMTNWDTLVERAAAARTIPHRLHGPPSDGELLILKLHGSIDWIQKQDAKKNISKYTYADLAELLGSTRAQRRDVQSSDVLRTRVANPGATWRTIKGATYEPFMLTMSTPKRASRRLAASSISSGEADKYQ